MRRAQSRFGGPSHPFDRAGIVDVGPQTVGIGGRMIVLGPRHTLFGGETPFRSMKEVPPLQSSEILNRSVNLINCRAFICRLGLAV